MINFPLKIASLCIGSICVGSSNEPTPKPDHLADVLDHVKGIGQKFIRGPSISDLGGDNRGEIIHFHEKSS